jgi:hypothetical protein
MNCEIAKISNNYISNAFFKYILHHPPFIGNLEQVYDPDYLESCLGVDCSTLTNFFLPKPPQLVAHRRGVLHYAHFQPKP